MGLKRQKRHHKYVRFYKACFGFRDPFKVLCDGTFVHHLLQRELTPPDTVLSRVLGANVKVFTTSCVLAELKRLGESHSKSLQAARNLIIASCEHEKTKSAVACIKEIIGEDNSKHFFVASQDDIFRRELQEIPGVPLIFGLPKLKSLFLEPPSEYQRQFAKSTEEERSCMSEFEYKRLGLAKKSMFGTEEALESSDVNEFEGHQNLGTQIVTKTNSGRKRMEVRDRVQFKRKKAKGPNPLSCKKKKNLGHLNFVSNKETNNGADTTRSRSRKRKRSRKGKKLEETNG